jgi:hypothetical protein
MVVDAEGNGDRRARGIEGGVRAVAAQESVDPVGVDVDSDDLATVVDRERLGGGGAGHVEADEPTARPQEGVVSAGGVFEDTYHLAAVVDPVRHRARRPGHVDPRYAPARENEPARAGVRVGQERAGLVVGANDLAAVVDLVDLGSSGAGEVDSADPTALSRTKPDSRVGVRNSPAISPRSLMPRGPSRTLGSAVSNVV